VVFETLGRRDAGAPAEQITTSEDSLAIMSPERRRPGGNSLSKIGASVIQELLRK